VSGSSSAAAAHYQRDSGIEGLGSTGHALHPHLGGNAVYYSGAGAGWPIPPFMSAHGLHHDVYHVEPGLSISGGHGAGTGRHVGSRSLRQVRRCQLVRSHSL
jgi:hypothetical protein